LWYLFEVWPTPARLAVQECKRWWWSG
jgi:hypothetical protein